MIFFVCSVRDRAADVYQAPFFVPSVGVAKRSFHDAINSSDPNNPMASHCEDFDLFSLGTYDDHTARFTLNQDPVQIAIGKDCRKPLPTR